MRTSVAAVVYPGGLSCVTTAATDVRIVIGGGEGGNAHNRVDRVRRTLEICAMTRPRQQLLLLCYSYHPIQLLLVVLLLPPNSATMSTQAQLPCYFCFYLCYGYHPSFKATQ